MKNPSIPIRSKSRNDPYAESARLYGACLDPIIIRWKKKALKLWPPRKGMVVLDAGCGTGAQLNLYRYYGCSVFGVEISGGMIAAARKKFQGLLNMSQGNADRMPYRNQAFDLILLSMMLHEIPPDTRTAVLAETRRVLKDSGRILIIDYRAGRPNRPMGRLFKSVISLIEMAAGRPHYDNYRNFMETGGLTPLLKKHRLIVAGHDTAGRGNIGLNIVQKA
ncbi:MAG: methyltransferase domain-containing protein [Desulfobacterales bacterium]|nr:methyltransferase domain-containing protein [Desulfobacterales bacterium]